MCDCHTCTDKTLILSSWQYWTFRFKFYFMSKTLRWMSTTTAFLDNLMCICTQLYTLDWKNDLEQFSCSHSFSETGCDNFIFYSRFHLAGGKPTLKWAVKCFWGLFYWNFGYIMIGLLSRNVCAVISINHCNLSFIPYRIATYEVFPCYEWSTNLWEICQHHSFCACVA